MPHAIVVKAQKVLQNPENYSEVIVSMAKQIDSYSTKKRVAIATMWANHSDFITWVKFYHSSDKSSKHLRCVEANTKVAKYVGKDNMNKIYIARQYIKRTRLDNAMTFEMFDAILKLHEFANIKLVHSYLSCVNAERLDESLSDVAFLRWIRPSYVSEIITWKLLNNA